MAQLKSTNITGNLAVTGNILASKIIKLGGTNDDILMGDGSITSKQGLIDSLEAAMEGNTWRPVKYGDTTVSDTSTTLEFAAGSNIGLTFTGGKLTITNNYSYSLPLAANGTRGGIQIGFSETEVNRAIKLSSEKAYISLPSRLDSYKATVDNSPNYNGFYFFNNTSDESAKTAFDSSAQAATWVSAYSDRWGGQIGISYYSDTIAFRRKQDNTSWGNWISIATKSWVEGKGYITSHQSLADYVKGPGSSTSNAIAVFNGTGGKTIKNTGVTIDSSNVISTAGGIKLTSGNCSLRIYNTSASPTDYSAIEVRSNSTSTNRNLFIDLGNNSLVVGAASGTADTTYKMKVNGTLGVTEAVTANGFKHSDSTTGTNDYVLLAGGGTKSLSDFGTGSGNVTGSGLTENYLVLGNGGSSIKKGTYRITTDIENDATNAYLPTAEAVDTFVSSKLSGVGGSDKKTSSSSKANTELKLVGAVTVSTDGVETFTNPNCYIGTDNCLYSNGKKVATEEWVETAIKDKIVSATLYSEVLYDAEGSVGSAVWTPGWRVDTGSWDASVKNNNTAASYTMATVTSSNQTVTLRRPYSPETTHSRWVMEVAASGLHGLSVSGATVTTVSNNKYKIQFAATTNQTITLSKGEATFIIKIVFQTASYQD